MLGNLRIESNLLDTKNQSDSETRRKPGDLDGRKFESSPSVRRFRSFCRLKPGDPIGGETRRIRTRFAEPMPLRGSVTKA